MATAHDRTPGPPAAVPDAVEPPPGSGLTRVIGFFRERLDPDWEIYPRPHLNGCRPDLVLLNPGIGIAVYQVPEWRLTAATFRCERRDEGQAGHILTRGPDGSWTRQPDPFTQARFYREAIFDLYAPTLRRECGRDAPAVVTAGVIFLNADDADLRRFRQASGWQGHDRYNPVAGKAALDRGALPAVFPEYARRSSKLMSEEAAAELRPWLREPEHRASQRRPLPLDKAQQQLVHTRTDSGYRRIRGPAGSGKTHVLAARAAYLEGRGKRVLILTYNITLVRYIGDLIQRARLPHRHGQNITVLSFHAWCKWVCHEAGMEHDYRSLWRGLQESDRESARKRIINRSLPRLTAQALEVLNEARQSKPSGYDALLVDEGQDWLPGWWNVAREAVVTGGECVLAADVTQDLYGKAEVWTEEAMVGAGMRGRWNELHGSHRLPPAFVPYLTDYGEHFLSREGRMLPKTGELPLDAPVRMRWWQVPPDGVAAYGAKAVCDLATFSARDPAAYSDVVLLAQYRQLGLAAARHLQSAGINVVHTYGSEEADDREAKLGFAMGRSRVKATTVHSIKGWEARYLVVCISDFETAESRVALYVALSRLKASDIGSTSYITVVCGNPKLADYGASWPECFML